MIQQENTKAWRSLVHLADFLIRLNRKLVVLQAAKYSFAICYLQRYDKYPKSALGAARI